MVHTEFTSLAKPNLQWCTCGVWQDYLYPCRHHGCAVFRKWDERDLRYVLQNHVHRYYTFEYGKVLSLVVRLLPLCGEAVGSKPAGKLFNQNLKILTPNPPLPTSRGRQGRVLSEILTKGHIRR